MDNLFILSDVHFLRPLWLLLLIPTPLLLWLLKRRVQQASAWQRIIDPRLHSVMLNQESQVKKQSSYWPLWAIAWLIAVVALAGPASVKIPQPISKNHQALIILLDMSASMASQDVAPSRATRALQKVTDIVRSRTDGVTGLVVYSGEAHTVTPLTDDTRTIETLLPALSPFIMPAPGSRPEKAVKLGRELANNAGVQQADLLLITDGIQEQDIERIQAELRTGLKLSVITVGTEQGAPIPLPSGGFLRDQSNQIVLAPLDLEPIKQLSSRLSAPWRELTVDDRDWLGLVSQPHDLEQHSDKAQQEFDLWRDDGFWLIFLLLPFTLLLFRRGVLLCLPLALWVAAPEPVEASPWLNANQQGMTLFETAPDMAANTFTDSAWKGSAFYRAGDYESAINAFETAPDTADNLYNLGNALAQTGEYQKAIDAYDKALKKKPDFPSAIKNKQIVEDAMKQQQQQQQDGEGDSDSDNQSNPGDDSQESDSSSQEPSDDDSDNANSDSSQNQTGDNNDQQSDDYNPQKEDNHSESDNQDSEQPDNANNSEDEQPQDNEQASQQETQEDESSSEQEENASALTESSEEGLTREEQEAMQRWLQSIPDNPGNLLQRKFLYQYRQSAPEEKNSGEVLW